MKEINYFEKRLVELESIGLFEENMSLYLIDTPILKDLKSESFMNLSKNDFFVFVRGYSDSIKVGSTFDTIISRKSTLESVYQKSIIKYLSVRKGDNIDYLPRGYSAVCLLEFPDGIPEIIKKIQSRVMEKHESTYDQMILSQKSALDYILGQ